MSQHGWISGRWPAEELNKVGDDLIQLLGGNIPMEAEYKAGKEVQIQLAKAVALENNRGSITTAQKAGRATKPIGLGSGSESGSETELVNALAIADLVLANRQWPLINWEPIDQLVDIDVRPVKSVPIDQSAQLANGAQHSAHLIDASLI